MPRPPAEPLDDLESAKHPLLLVVIDIPGCGGETLALGMPPAVTARREAGPLPRVFAGGGGIEPEDIEELREAARTLKMKGVRMLRGSIPFTVSTFLTQYAGKRAFRYVTFLRDPVDRTLAEYAQVPRAAGMTIDEAIDAGLVRDNLQTRMLSGSVEPFADVTPDLLEAAKANLKDRFHFFGLAERVDESLVLAASRLELTTTIYRNDPALPPLADRSEFPPGSRKVARRRNRFDVELYRYAEELFGAAAEFSQLEFQCEVAAVRASRGDEIEVTAPVPETFNGGEEAWGMLVRARAECLRLEWELEAADGPSAELVGAAEG